DRPSRNVAENARRASHARVRWNAEAIPLVTVAGGWQCGQGRSLHPEHVACRPGDNDTVPRHSQSRVRSTLAAADNRAAQTKWDAVFDSELRGIQKLHRAPN